MSRSMEGTTIIILFCSTFLITASSAVDNITANQTITDDGNSTIESAGGVFQLGFFSPGSSENRYLGIWYKKIPNKTVVWVANRETPLTDTSGVLRIHTRGNLVLLDGNDNIIWSTNSSSRSVAGLVAQLLDDGNFVLSNGSENLLWQSFDHPGDHLLPGMKLGSDLVKNLDRHLTSWKSVDDPSPGDFTAKFIPSGYPQLLLMKNSVTQFRFGPWDGIQFSGQSRLGQNITGSFIKNDLQIYYKYDVLSSSIVARMVLNPNGTIQLLRWIDQIQSWEIDPSLTAQRDDCDHYALCGAYSSCYLTKSQLGYVTCRCLNGYQPKVSAKWNLADWSDGCIRQAPLDCIGDDFVQYTGLKLPDTQQSWFNVQSINIKEDCHRLCLKNCSCTAYTTNIDIREGGIGCLLWFGDLIDIREYGENGQDLYIRMAASDLEANRSSRGKKRANISIIIVPVTVVPTILLGLLLMYVSKKKRLKRQLRSNGLLALNPENDGRTGNEREDLELPLIDFKIIADATNNFRKNNKLGEGGFGPVYKGILDNGQEIAVKRLSKSSKQGIDEFKNEVSCIAKLQHRNLVRLLGCCIEEGEMLLIYEYMSNNSLDSFIFDKELSKLLDWPKRYNIINGIAKGLLYLHQDSRLRIIHRDLKASNILLDYEMNPRISDFGLARTFGGNESAVNTTRVVGTYGYMPPEYVIDGLFSVKSDVYSFGVVVLEIVSGKKIRDFYQSDHNLNLLGHAWKLYTEGIFLELTDDAIVNCNHFEASRAIQIGLLCVQPYPKDRPSMSTVVSMLSNENELSRPKEPGFFTERQHGPDPSSSKHGSSSCAELTVTLFAPR